jgi:hypothetical protein
MGNIARLKVSPHFPLCLLQLEKILRHIETKHRAERDKICWILEAAIHVEICFVLFFFLKNRCVSSHFVFL